MKKHIFLILLISNALYCDDAVKLPRTAFMVDAMQAVVFSSDEPQIITWSDVTRPSLTGEQRNLEDLIFERAVYMDAHKYHIAQTIDEDAVDKYLAMIQKQNNMSPDELKTVFTSAGYTYEEGREQLKRLQTVNTMLDFKIRSQVVVPRTAVEQYYREHPRVTEARATVQRGFIPYEKERLDDQKKALEYMAQTGKVMKGIQWDDPFSVSESEIADDKAFIFALKKGEISHAKDIGIGFEVFRVQDSSPRTESSLEERYQEIADTLRKPIFDELMEKYKKGLMESTSVLYLQAITGEIAPEE
jgi:parvulin-like peptidyl-prolyl isomerase